MNRTVASLVVVVSLSAAADDWQRKVTEFQARAAAERKKLGLDRDMGKLKAKYPTPEVTFQAAGSEATCVQLCPGKTATVRLEGALQPKSLVVPQCEDVEVVNERFTRTGWEAVLRARPAAAPQQVSLLVMSPVSAIRTSVPGVDIGCTHTFTARAGEETLRFTTSFPCAAGDVTVPGEWTRGGKALGTFSYQVSRGRGTLRLSRVLTEAEALAQGEAASQANPAALAAFTARQEVLAAKLEACGKKPVEQMQACMAALQGEMAALQKEGEAVSTGMQLAMAPPFGCAEVQLELAAGALSGEARQCARRGSEDALPVSGRYTVP